MIGKDLVKGIMDVTDRCDWVAYDTYRFCINGEKVFDIEAHDKEVQKRSAIFKFWISKDRYNAPKYSMMTSRNVWEVELQQSLKHS